MGIKEGEEKRTKELRWEGVSQGTGTEVEDLIECNLVRVIQETDERAAH